MIIIQIINPTKIFFYMEYHVLFQKKTQEAQTWGTTMTKWPMYTVSTKSKPIVFFVIVTLKLVDWCLLFNSTFSTNRLYHAMEVWNISRRARGQHRHNKTMTQYTNKIINTLRSWLCGDDHLATVRLPQWGLSSQSFGKYWQINQNNQRTEHICDLN